MREFERSRGGALRSIYRKSPRIGQADWEDLDTDSLITMNQIFLRQQEAMDDILWDGYPGFGGPFEQQHVAMCNIVDYSIPQRVNEVQGRASVKLEEVIWNG